MTIIFRSVLCSSRVKPFYSFIKKTIASVDSPRICSSSGCPGNPELLEVYRQGIKHEDKKRVQSKATEMQMEFSLGVQEGLGDLA